MKIILFFWSSQLKPSSQRDLNDDTKFDLAYSLDILEMDSWLKLWNSTEWSWIFEVLGSSGWELAWKGGVDRNRGAGYRIPEPRINWLRFTFRDHTAVLPVSSSKRRQSEWSIAWYLMYNPRICRKKISTRSSTIDQRRKRMLRLALDSIRLLVRLLKFCCNGIRGYFLMNFSTGVLH